MFNFAKTSLMSFQVLITSNWHFQFCKSLIDVLSGVNNQQPTCSILVGGFKAKLSKWCPSDKDSKAGRDIYTFKQLRVTLKWLVNRRIFNINDKSSYIDLLFTTNSKLFCDVGIEQTIYNKCNHNIIYGSLYLNMSSSTLL